MFLNVYFATLFIIHISSCLCFVSYEQFPGFEETYNVLRYKLPLHSANFHKNKTGRKHTTYKDFTSTPITKGSTSKKKIKPDITRSTSRTRATAITTSSPLLPLTYPKFNCSEDEQPINIGTYEVPTQRDMVLQIQATLKRMFNQYQEKAMDLLQDIQQATEATSDVEMKCLGNHIHRTNYKNCVRQVRKQCEFITKSLVTALERQRADVSAFFDGSICNVTEIRTDPLQLIKTLAMEQASLEFALPGFLRLLGSCSVYCEKNHNKINFKKPLRHMTDQDLVVRHFLTKKSYAQLISNPNK